MFQHKKMWAAGRLKGEQNENNNACSWTKSQWTRIVKNAWMVPSWEKCLNGWKVERNSWMARRLSSFSFLRYFLVGKHQQAMGSGPVQWSRSKQGISIGDPRRSCGLQEILVAVVLRNPRHSCDKKFFQRFCASGLGWRSGLGGIIYLNKLDIPLLLGKLVYQTTFYFPSHLLKNDFVIVFVIALSDQFLLQIHIREGESY